MTASSTNGGVEVAVVRRFIDEVINGGQLDLVDELWSEDLAWHGGSLGEIHGLASYKDFLRAAVEGAFSGMHLTVHDVVAADGKVAVRFTNSGTHTGTFMRAPATGKRAEWLGIAVYTVVAGRLRKRGTARMCSGCCSNSASSTSRRDRIENATRERALDGKPLSHAAAEYAVT